jgi:hypothetical protein
MEAQKGEVTQLQKEKASAAWQPDAFSEPAPD